MEDLVLTPAECVALINQTLEIAYPTVMVEGEVSSFKVSREKYIFFDLKDDEATLPCFMMAWTLRTPIEDGMRIKVLAEPRLTRWGKFSLTVRQVMPVGQGSIKKAFEILRAKLEAEGLLDESRKRALPSLPRRIGVVSSVEAAGYADFIKILHARWGGVEVEVANVQVQGLAAIEQNIAAITHFNQQALPVDVLVIIRGGGSADDLAAYNDEQLARAIAASRIPTIVGVGHEVDTSLADLVADVRAATPSNAAQIVVPDRSEILGQLDALRRQLNREIDQAFASWQQIIASGMQHMSRVLDVSQLRTRVTHMGERIAISQQRVLERADANVHGLMRTLRQVDPDLPLKRGYARVKNAAGEVVTSGQNLVVGDMIRVELADAAAKAEVQSVEKRGNHGD